MERRELLSWGLPVIGLTVTVPELVRLAGLPSPDPVLVALAVVLTLAFAARILFLARPFLRR